ncbi:altronate dehydrogenase [Planctomycetaceae bacterium SCGC AG-212-F19]|nr:altronate dehydrogenase [Planctomycetaceae bacterium SCGC AG-212-F19]
MQPLPETILQFGGGQFLRAFADFFVHESNQAGQNVGRVVIVQSTEGQRANQINEQKGAYHVVVRGLENGKPVDCVHKIESVSRGLDARTQWPDVLALACSPQVRWIISNTTESGFTLDPADKPTDAPPRSFPAKLLTVLRARFAACGFACTIIPCELFEKNADKLRGIVVNLARVWQLDPKLIAWLEKECTWLNTLVDRIVTGKPAEHPLLATDPLLTVAEPFAFWAIEKSNKPDDFFTHPAILRVDDVMPYTLRKVRILNGSHTAMACKALPMGLKIVREVVAHPELGPWLRRLIFEEIVPTLEGRVDGPRQFAEQVLERFANPFQDHKLTQIVAYHQDKMKLRILPTRAEYFAKFGKAPPLLDEVIALSAQIN